MTVLVANVITGTDTFSQWITKTNALASAMSNVVVTVNSNTAAGNAAISGSFAANVIYGNFLSGGNTSAAAQLNVSTNSFFTANVSFVGYRTNLGLGANVQINAGNSTFRFLTVNSAASNTLFAAQISSSDISDMLKVYYANGIQAYP
jgi:hypothetical protein